MDLRGLTEKAKELIAKRGGTDSLKEDAEELKDIAKGEGSVADKAKDSVEAVKHPGADEAEAPAAEGASETERARAEEKVAGEARGKHKHADERRGGRRGAGGRRRDREGRDPAGPGGGVG
jgi:hypothetical protein